MDLRWVGFRRPPLWWRGTSGYKEVKITAYNSEILRFEGSPMSYTVTVTITYLDFVRRSLTATSFEGH